MSRWALALGAVVFCLLLLGAPRSWSAGVARPNSARGFAAIVGGASITQGFGCTTVTLEPIDPGCASGHFHSGIDLAAPLGTPVFAAAAGVCFVVNSAYGYGLHVVIQHGPSLLTLYGHLSRALVTSGQAVQAGEEIGLLGSSGLSTGPHVHFEIRQAGLPVDPGLWLPVLQGWDQPGAAAVRGAH